ncbi:MAG: hypothetical protein IPN16_13400 [Gemmatimonadetes bacterium]|nr:hypothetical protein [Gemmatimonadota bacterium]
MDVLIGGRLNTLFPFPFATGGEGALHDHACAGSPLAVKLYRFGSTTGARDARRERAEYLVRHPPACRASRHEGWEVAWPTELVTTEDGDFVGVAIPRVRRAVRLSELTAHARTVTRRVGLRWAGYSLPSPLGRALRLQLAARVARAVSAVHAGGRYVLADLKPDNLMVDLAGHVTLVDCDSVQVAEQGTLRVSAPVRTDDYTPAEGQRHPAGGRTGADVPLAPSWDAFSLAVIIYQLLLGIHPFAVRGRDPVQGTPVDTLRDAIGAGLYAHSPSRANLLVTPAPHAAIERLPRAVREALHETFVAGHAHPDRRLTSGQWAALLEPWARSPGRWLRARRVMAGGLAIARAQASVARAFALRLAQRGRERLRQRLHEHRTRQWRVHEDQGPITRRDAIAFSLGAAVAFIWMMLVTTNPSPAESTALPVAPPSPSLSLQPTVALRDAPLLWPVADVFSGRAAHHGSPRATTRRSPALALHTVLTYARAGVIVRRDSVTWASDSAIVLARRWLPTADAAGATDTVRYARAADGLRFVAERDSLLLLPVGGRIGDAWWSMTVGTRLVTARALGMTTTLAGPVPTVELLVRGVELTGVRERRLWLSARYGIVRELDDGGDDSTALELIAVMPHDSAASWRR